MKKLLTSVNNIGKCNIKISFVPQGMRSSENGIICIETLVNERDSGGR